MFDNLRGKILAIGLGILVLTGLVSVNKLVEVVDADEIVVIQSVFTGSLTWYTTPGPKPQLLGSATHYQKRDIYEFENQIRFNDGAHGTMIGSIQFELPTDEQNLTALHVRFGGPTAVKQQLVQKVVDKATYMTGPLMSSKESYAERRNSLISYVEDQVAHGVYQTTQNNVRIKDPISNVEKTITVVDIVMVNGVPKRAEEAVLVEFGIKPFNFAMSRLDYDKAVESQIQAQQEATMAVQTKMAEARQAEQDALTAEAEGKAAAARSQWKQEVIKAQAITLAEQEKEVAVTEAKKKRDVATLDAEAAEQYKIATLLRAEADATAKKKIIEADGALAQKLNTYERVQGFWAQAYASRQVPAMVFGATGDGGTDTSMKDFMTLMTANAAKDLTLDLATK